jgi:hypothetical protein
MFLDFLVGNVPQLRDFYTINGLWPGTQYTIKVMATNSAGTTTTEYIVFTQAALGGKQAFFKTPFSLK